MRSLPKVVLVGGPDVDARLELMQRLGADVNVSALGSQPSLHSKFLAAGFDYRSYHLSRRVNPFLDLLTLGQLALIFRRLKPQIVHAFDTKPGVWACLSARLAAVPIVIGTLTGLGRLYASDGLQTRFVRQSYQLLQKLACQVSDLTIFQNHDDARQFTAEGVVSTQKALVIPGSGVVTEVFTPARVSATEKARVRAELDIPAEALVATMIARVIRSKGVLEFMAVAQEVGRSFPQVRFLLIGPADDDSADRLSPAELVQLKQMVAWPGPRRDIPTVLALSDIFVFPSAYREGIPRVLLEAASMGLPLVTTDSPGCNEVVEDGVTGLLAPIRDQAALTGALVRLVQQPELRQRLGRAARQRAVERFDLSVIAGQTREAYQQLLERKGLLRTTAAY